MREVGWVSRKKRENVLKRAVLRTKIMPLLEGRAKHGKEKKEGVRRQSVFVPPTAERIYEPVVMRKFVIQMNCPIKRVGFTIPKGAYGNSLRGRKKMSSKHLSTKAGKGLKAVGWTGRN